MVETVLLYCQFHFFSKQVSNNGLLDQGDLEARSGPIQAAINLEITTEKISHINVKIDGLNGQLPNLDLVNLVYRLCMREGVHQMFQGVEDHPRPDSWKGYSRLDQ
jgi:glycosylphosphatidylinositol transamidase